MHDIYLIMYLRSYFDVRNLIYSSHILLLNGKEVDIDVPCIICYIMKMFNDGNNLKYVFFENPILFNLSYQLDNLHNFPTN